MVFEEKASWGATYGPKAQTLSCYQVRTQILHGQSEMHSLQKIDAKCRCTISRSREDCVPSKAASVFRLLCVPGL